MTQFCLGSISNGFRAINSREASLKVTVFDFFSVHYNAVDKPDLLNIHNDLMIKNCIIEF